MEDNCSMPKSLVELAARCDSTYQDWQALNRDPACWSEPEKRRAMLTARIAYQDALSEYVTALRASNLAHNKDKRS